ncbi:uncharacterized protein K444DRAFT_379931 [Hyaloscypha bicolor E]|uniref:Uncharacterized protein n=1 Tax=Hyaloscypha bicolor E TaxID=1095630 RepID=A0A2J6TFK4_9HELO|nr:uncharacterized protein K444DRAFT_379931 [Hyaloscypha bicolor E]PMD61804.1 hypothetical protein K444DRAFT_379931 [Hyaloscypha bicolor E]
MEAWKAETEALKAKAEAWKAETEALKAENEALKARAEALKAETEAWKAEAEALRAKAETLKADLRDRQVQTQSKARGISVGGYNGETEHHSLSNQPAFNELNSDLEGSTATRRLTDELSEGSYDTPTWSSAKSGSGTQDSVSGGECQCTDATGAGHKNVLQGDNSCKESSSKKSHSDLGSVISRPEISSGFPEQESARFVEDLKRSCQDLYPTDDSIPKIQKRLLNPPPRFEPDFVRLAEAYMETMERVLIPWCTEYLHTLIGHGYIISHTLKPESPKEILFITPEPVNEVKADFTRDLIIKDLLPRYLNDVVVRFEEGHREMLALTPCLRCLEHCPEKGIPSTGHYFMVPSKTLDPEQLCSSTIGPHFFLGQTALQLVCRHAMYYDITEGKIIRREPRRDDDIIDKPLMHFKTEVGKIRPESGGDPYHRNWRESKHTHFDGKTKGFPYMDWQLASREESGPLIPYGHDCSGTCHCITKYARPRPGFKVRYTGAYSGQVEGEIALMPSSKEVQYTGEDPSSLRGTSDRISRSILVSLWEIDTDEPSIDRRGDSGATVVDIDTAEMVGIVVQQYKRRIQFMDIVDVLEDACEKLRCELKDITFPPPNCKKDETNPLQKPVARVLDGRSTNQESLECDEERRTKDFKLLLPLLLHSTAKRATTRPSSTPDQLSLLHKLSPSQRVLDGCQPDEFRISDSSPFADKRRYSADAVDPARTADIPERELEISDCTNRLSHGARGRAR